MRRIQHQMDRVGVQTFEEYLDVLQTSSDEFAALFDTILINVTAFYHDPEAWQFMRDEVVPALLARRRPDEPIRIWSAGCASGQEAYTLAMVLADALEPDAFRHRVKIYATDFDEQALSHFRTYDRRRPGAVPFDVRRSTLGGHVTSFRSTVR
jgi:two-component system CheB/CheR fusion protein